MPHLAARNLAELPRQGACCECSSLPMTQGLKVRYACSQHELSVCHLQLQMLLQLQCRPDPCQVSCELRHARAAHAAHITCDVLQQQHAPRSFAPCPGASSCDLASWAAAAVHLCCLLLLIVLSLESRDWLPRALCKGWHAAHTSYMLTAAYLLLLEVQDLAGAGWAEVLHVNGICTDGQVCMCARLVSCLLRDCA